MRRPPMAVQLVLAAVAGVVLALVLALLRAVVHEVGPEIAAGRPVRGFWLGTALAVVAWAPVGVWFLRRWRQSWIDPWFLGAVGWGVLVCAVAVTPGGAAGRDLGRYDALLASAPSWLLGWTAAGWIAVSFARTRQRTPG